MAEWLLIVSFALVIAWFRAREDVQLPAAWERALSNWRKRFGSAPVHKLELRAGEDLEQTIMQVLAELRRTSGRAGVLLQIAIPGDGNGGDDRVLRCLSRRFPEVELLVAYEQEVGLLKWECEMSGQRKLEQAIYQTKSQNSKGAIQ